AYARAVHAAARELQRSRDTRDPVAVVVAGLLRRYRYAVTRRQRHPAGEVGRPDIFIRRRGEFRLASLDLHELAGLWQRHFDAVKEPRASVGIRQLAAKPD